MSLASLFVLSGQVGDVGGAAKATRLLCESAAEVGLRVTLFVTLPPDAEVRLALEERGIAVVTPRVNRGWRWGLPQRLIAWQLHRAARRRPPSLIHSVSLSPEARVLLRLGPAAPLCLWESTEALPHVKFLAPGIERYLSRAAAVLVPSETVGRNVRRTYGYTGPVRLLPFWVEACGAAGPPRHRRTGNLLYLGRLDADKGFEYLVEAFRRHNARHPGATLTICGGGDLAMVSSLVAGHPAIEVRGRVDAAGYEAALAHADALVLPSLHEGYPLTLLEACARGKPVLASAVGSIPEVFGGRRCALLVPARDAESLAAAMTTLAEEPDQAFQERSLDARLRYEEVSSPGVVREQLRRAYAPFLGEPAATAC